MTYHINPDIPSSNEVILQSRLNKANEKIEILTEQLTTRVKKLQQQVIELQELLQQYKDSIENTELENEVLVKQLAEANEIGLQLLVMSTTMTGDMPEKSTKNFQGEIKRMAELLIDHIRPC